MYMYMYIGMYVCMHACMHVCMHAYREYVWRRLPAGNGSLYFTSLNPDLTRFRPKASVSRGLLCTEDSRVASRITCHTRTQEMPAPTKLQNYLEGLSRSNLGSEGSTQNLLRPLRVSTC